MKKLFAFGVFAFSITLIFGQDAKPMFDASKLSKEELQNCEAFKAKKGQPRWDEFQKIKHIFPSCEYTIDSTKTILTNKEETVTVIMTKNQLLSLIGEPDFPNGGYELGETQCDCEVYFSLNKGDEILGFTYANCRTQFNLK